jgi:nucleotide-binding universal stress UspA family protein
MYIDNLGRNAVRLVFAQRIESEGFFMLYDHIVTAFDGSEQSKQALEAAIGMVKTQPNAKVTVVHVYSTPTVVLANSMLTASASEQKERYDLAVSLLTEVKDRLDKEQLQGSSVELLEGSPAASILRFAELHDASLIIIGSRGLTGLREFMLGSVSKAIVQNAKMPVLVMK